MTVDSAPQPSPMTMKQCGRLCIHQSGDVMCPGMSKRAQLLSEPCPNHRAPPTHPPGLTLPNTPNGTLGYCTCAEDAISMMCREENGLVSGLKDHRHLLAQKSPEPGPMCRFWKTE